MAINASFSPSTSLLSVFGHHVGNTITASRDAAGQIPIDGGAPSPTPRDVRENRLPQIVHAGRACANVVVGDTTTQLPAQEDRASIEMITSGRYDKFERVVLPHLDAAYNLARWLVRNPSVTEDVVQDALLRALKYFASFRGGSARAWLLQIVRNVSYSHIKAQRTKMEIALGGRIGPAEEESKSMGMDMPDPGVGPDDAIIHRQEIGQAYKTLETLPLELRECLILRELEELSYKEIAQITDIPIGTVMSRLSRARQAFSKAAKVSSAAAQTRLCQSTSMQTHSASARRESDAAHRLEGRRLTQN